MKLCQVGLAGQALEVAADDGVGLGQLRHALLGGVLALAAHVIDEAFAVQRGADHAGGGLQGRQFRGVDRAVLAGIVEAHHADELTGDEDRHDRLGLSAHALDAGDRRPPLISLLLKQTLRPARNSAHTAAKWRSSQVVARRPSGVAAHPRRSTR